VARNPFHRPSLSLGFCLLVLVLGACSTTQESSPVKATFFPGQESLPTASSLAPVQGEVRFEDSCSEIQFNFLTDLEVYPVPDLDQPQPHIPYIDPVFGTCVVRATNRLADLTAGDPSGGIKNEYSRVQSFNADGSLFIAYSTEGNWYLYDAASLNLLGQIPITHEPRWDAVDPDLIYFTEESRLMSYRISNGQQHLVHEFADDFPGQDLAAIWTKYEGSPSIDGRYWGLMAEDPDWMAFALLVYDLQSDQVIARREFAPSEIDSVTISPLANYLLVYFDNYCEPGFLGSDESPCGLMVYDQNLEHGRGLLRIVGHSDTALDTNNREVLVFQDIDTDHLSMLDLSSGEITPLVPIDFTHSSIGFHFSGRSFRRPGWALVSTSNGSQPSLTWMDDLIFAVELRQDGRIVRLAHTRSISDEKREHDYWAEPHASVNQDFTRIVFTSNWGRAGTDELDTYLIYLPANWVSLLR
jgi:hypothetical protein